MKKPKTAPAPARPPRAKKPTPKTYYSEALGRRVTVPENDPEPEPHQALSQAILVAEDGLGGYELLGVVATPAEAAEIATGDWRRRLRLLDAGRAPMFVDTYKVFALARFDDDAMYRLVLELPEAPDAYTPFGAPRLRNE
jgi:hypothetical protein